MIPESVPFSLTTDTVNLLLPGMVKTYGSGTPVDVRFNVTSLGDFGVSQANEYMNGTTSLSLQFFVELADGTTEMAADLSLNDIEFQFTALVDNMDISLNVAKLNVGSVDVVSDTIGRLSGLTIKVELNNGFRIALPIINKVLASHVIPFPSTIIPIFELSNLTLDYYDNYIYAGATPTFIAPSKDIEEVYSSQQAVQFTTE